MIKIFKDNLQADRIKNIDRSIGTVISRLKNVKEDLQLDPNKYDLDTLVDILSQLYDDFGEFCIVAQTENTIY